VTAAGRPHEGRGPRRRLTARLVLVTLIALAGAWAWGRLDGPAAPEGPSGPPPRTAADELLWRADAERPLREEWASIATTLHCTELPRAADARFRQVTSPVVQGARAYRSEVRDGDRCFGERSEVGQANPLQLGFSGPRLFRPGQRRWISWRVLLGSGFPVGTHTWQLLAQFKQVGGLEEPVLSLAVRDGRWELLASPADPRRTRGFQRFDAGPAVTGRWTRFTLAISFSADPHSGSVALLGDGGRGGRTTVVVPTTHVATLKVDPARGLEQVPSHARIGIYRDPAITGTAVAYYDAYAVALTRRAAEGDGR
jgi:hypothetical protein